MRSLRDCADNIPRVGTGVIRRVGCLVELLVGVDVSAGREGPR